MFASGRKPRHPRLALSVLGVLTFVVAGAATVVAILNAWTFSTAHVSFSGLAVAAAALEALSLAALIVFLIQYAVREDGDRRSFPQRWGGIALACILLSLACAIITLIMIVLIRYNLDKIVSTSSSDEVVFLLPPTFVLWGFSVLMQVTFYTACFLLRNSSPSSRPSASAQEPCDLVVHEVREPTPPVSLDILPPPHARDSPLPSPTFSLSDAQSTKSWRLSVHQVVRPVTSRTKLLPRRQSTPRDSESIYSVARSTQTGSESDGFDTWDTSSVDPQYKDTIIHSAPSKGTALEPIPGSRPPSPARALEGPFPFEDTPELKEERSPPPSPSPSRPQSRPPSPAAPPPQPSFSRRPSTSHSTHYPPASPTLNEAHIHPLFRSDSPTPPPAATPGTIVTAAPFGGQTLASPPPRPFSRQRSDSRLATSSPLIFSQQAEEEEDEGVVGRTPTPPSRQMTPPIPESIYAGSPRVSPASQRSFVTAGSRL
ncbi:hypothetical protein W97_00953 [Coniosporium apollinis CBS 100218]|uniref:Uncharacterized protein n=1 Tax=Coniosporium apollinis (strain CBS 100218) TaxID=1168221 RepID=R7YIJ0_CONA1|nr:uncharacterized protein W97_00953 [Coniosporium apollinis CBS 100218]EON61737.1 hypothetical protein W97_00953 [Coniosporium apollinis CBS 100218]